MKRPEGFDRPPEPSATEGKASRVTRGSGAESLAGASSRGNEASAQGASDGSLHGASHGAPPAASSGGGPSSSPRGASSAPMPRGQNAPPSLLSAERDAQRRLSRAARSRRRYEKSEVRRFTRRSRRRRVTWIVAAGVVVSMGALLAVAVYSPLLALRTITIEGTSRLSAAEIHDAVDGQLDTPLALIDFSRITKELGRFPLIRSYVTEAVPPNTLIIHVVERQPIGQLAVGSGFTLVDPAGITVETSTERTAGVPLIETGGQSTGSTAFSAAVEVLVALPPSMLEKLDTITAASTDNVHLTLVGNGAQIIWGSAENSAYKARVLEAALANFPKFSEYNVSAPGQLTYR